MSLTKVPAQMTEADLATQAELDAVNAAAVHLTGNETIGGTKTFSSQPVLPQKLTLGTSQATTSGTSKDFTSIPSWVQKITVCFRGISTVAGVDMLVQVGSGSVQTTGYVSTGAYAATANQAGAGSSTAGFIVTNGNAAQTISGVMTLVHMGSNVWIASYSGKINATVCGMAGGDVALSGVLDRLRLTTTNGTDTFDAGSVNILYEG